MECVPEYGIVGSGLIVLEEGILYAVVDLATGDPHLVENSLQKQDILKRWESREQYIRLI